MILETKFNLETFTHSDTADAKKIDNTVMSQGQLADGIKLHSLLLSVQRQVSIKLARQVILQINSGFRSKALNDYFRRSIGASKTSQHMDFQAADTVAVGVKMEDYFIVLKYLARNNMMQFGQVMIEFGKHPEKESDDWIHISTPARGILNDFRRAAICKADGAKTEGKREYLKESL